MNTAKRAARAKRRAKSNRLTRRGVPFNASKFSVHGTWRMHLPWYLGGRVTASPQHWQSYRKKARRAHRMDELDGTIFPDYLEQPR